MNWILRVKVILLRVKSSTYYVPIIHTYTIYILYIYNIRYVMNWILRVEVFLSIH